MSNDDNNNNELNNKDIKMSESVTEEDLLNKLNSLEGLFETLSKSHYQSFGTFVKALNLADEIDMKDQAKEIWSQWRRTWLIGENYHLNRISRYSSSTNEDVESYYQAGLEDNPSSIRLSVQYINYLLQGYCDKIPEDNFSESSIRQAFVNAYENTEWDLSGNCEIWDKWRDWEESIVRNSTTPENINRLQQLYLARLKIPHVNHADTFSAYSTFVTTFDNSQYETHMVAANKEYQKGRSIWEEYDQWETAISASPTIEGYQAYLNHAQAPDGKHKFTNKNLVKGLFERATRDCYPFNSLDGNDGDGPSGSTNETIATGVSKLWVSYVQWMLNNKERPDKIINVLERSVKVCPWSGELWASFIEAHESLGHPVEKAEETYARALSTTLFESRIDDLVHLISARASYLRRKISPDDLSSVYTEVAAILEDGMERIKKRDPYIRIEKYAISWYERFNVDASLDAASTIYENLTKHNKQRRNFSIWLDWASFETRRENYEKARSIYKNATPRQFIDYPEAIHQAYELFEEFFGTLATQQQSRSQLFKARQSLAQRRQKEAYEQVQVMQSYNYSAGQPEQATASTNEAPTETIIDSTGTKRKAEATQAEQDDEGSKKQKVSQAVESFKRDRENTTVIVSGLPLGVNDKDISILFRDCGQIREIVKKEIGNQSAATVEFKSRDDILTALTKDKKRVADTEINVAMGWSTTLYVTNFPEGTQDENLREMFSPYGTIFDTRWPSRSIISNRRFAYVSFLDASSAQSSLELNGKLQEDGHTLSVAISDPSKRKSRTDEFTEGCEVFVRDLTRRTTEEDVRKLFEPFGKIKQAKVGLRDDGSCKGYAHVEFENNASAHASLSLNNTELKGRYIGVTMSNRKYRQANAPSKPRFDRSIRVENIPEGVKESSLQQIFEKTGPVKKVWFNEKGAERAAVIEFEDIKDMSKVLLTQAPTIEGQELSLSEESSHKKPLGSETFTPNLKSKISNDNVTNKFSNNTSSFVPRSARVRVGSRRVNNNNQTEQTEGNKAEPKSQDDFRKFLS